MHNGDETDDRLATQRADPRAAALDRPPLAGHTPDDVHELGALGNFDALGEGVNVVVILHWHRHLSENHAGIHALIHHEQRGTSDLDAIGQRIGGPVNPRERGEQRVVRVEVAPPKLGEEAWPAQLQETSGDHEIRIMLDDGRRERGVPLIAAAVLSHALHKRGKASLHRDLNSPGIVAVCSDSNDLDAVRRVVRRFEESSEVRPSTRNQHDNTARIHAASLLAFVQLARETDIHGG